MLIEFKRAGVSPEIGSFEVGEKRLIPRYIGDIFIERGLAVEVSSAVKKKREVKDNGGK